MDTSEYKIIEVPCYVITNGEDLKQFCNKYGRLSPLYLYPFIAGREPGFTFQSSVEEMRYEDSVFHNTKEIYHYVAKTLNPAP